MTTRSPNVRTLAGAVRAQHEHIRVAGVNDHALVLAVNEVPFPWHVHPESDELLFVIEGTLEIEFVDAPAVRLGPLDVHLVPAGTIHRTAPRGRCVNLLVERAGTETRLVEEDGAHGNL